MNLSIIVFQDFSILMEDDGKFITRITYTEETKENLISSLAETVKSEITEYLLGKRQQFDLPMKFSGTSFQKQVWNAIAQIPYGTTWTYKELSHKAGRPSAIRAVGTACGQNPLPLLIPCHRVVLSSGQVGNYTGPVGLKKKLLDIEKR